MTDYLVETNNLEFRYKPDLDPALIDINLKIREGDFLALIGQNGAGKTTLAKHFNGILRPTSGSVYIDGHDTKKMPLEDMARSISYCYQNPDHQIFSATVYGEIAFGPKKMGLEKEILEKRVEEALHLVDLWSFKDSHPFSLGRGQRQLLAVASAIVMKPRLLVVDEPTTGMDYRDSSRIMDLISEWNNEGQTIVVITHDMSLVAEYVPRSVVMASAHIIADGPTRDIFQMEDRLLQARLHPPLAFQMSLSLKELGIPPCLTPLELATEILTARKRRGGNTHADRL